MHFIKYHGLGNDYLVMNPDEIGRDLTKREIKCICHRNYGIGSDGLLWGPIQGTNDYFQLQIFNPNGSEAEKSGNGLRIFSRYLWDLNLVHSDKRFLMKTLGGMVEAVVTHQGKMVNVEMGQVSFRSRDIPVLGPDREVLNETICIQDRDYTFCAATIGNPHCVLLMDDISADLAKQVGPLIEIDPRFPNRTNVQFLKVIDKNNIAIEIWERGAGYTLASGSSSSAAASVANRLGLCEHEICVHMPGGSLDISISSDFHIKMAGPVAKIGEGTISEELFEAIPDYMI